MKKMKDIIIVGLIVYGVFAAVAAVFIDAMYGGRNENSSHSDFGQRLIVRLAWLLAILIGLAVLRFTYEKRQKKKVVSNDESAKNLGSKKILLIVLCCMACYLLSPIIIVIFLVLTESGDYRIVAFGVLALLILICAFWANSKIKKTRTRGN